MKPEQPMQELDFLPTQYRQKHVQRRSQPWRIVIVAAFIVLLGTATGVQYLYKQHVEEALAAITEPYDRVVRQAEKMAQVQSRLEATRTAAELYTYLHHPWPRTQLLAALLTPMPDQITFSKLEITYSTPQNQVRTERRSRSERMAEQEEDDKLSPAARDLKRLRDRFDKMVTVVLISGTTAESAALHDYLTELGNSRLFSNAELDWMDDNVDNEGGSTLRFDATVVVRPGYGQPQGPTGPNQDALVRTDSAGS